MVWRSTIDLESRPALDVHVNAGTSAPAPKGDAAGPTRDDTLARATQRSGVGGQTPDQTAAYYRERKIACAIWGVDTGGTRGARPGAVSNDEMLEAAERNSDVLIPFVMVDPWRDHAGADEAQRLIAAGARGFKFHPPSQGFYANDQRMYELYEVIAAAKLPALFHTGQTAVGQGARGGGGIRLKFGNHLPLDAAEGGFPPLPIIMHPPPDDHRRPLAGGLREGALPGRGQAPAAEGQRRPAAGTQRLMDKLVASPAEAIADLPDGARVAVSGFGQSAGSPVSLLAALRERGSRGLCLVGNTIQPRAHPLIPQHQA